MNLPPDNHVSQQLRTIAEQQLNSAVAALPADPIARLTVFIESTRVVDYRSIIQPFAPKERRLPVPDFEMILAGWNIVAAKCLTPISSKDAFPLMESTEYTQTYAMTLLHQFGRSILLRRVADMVQYGFLLASPTASGYTFTRAPDSCSQFLDIIEFQQLLSFERFLKESGARTYNGWNVTEHEDCAEIENHLGAFLSRQTNSLKNWIQKDINSLMLPLIRPWKTTCGTMMAYDALPEVDNHFLALAYDFINDCRNEVGIHPLAEIPTTSGGDITAIAGAIASFHMKHVRFAFLAMENHKEISIPQSITIWTPEDKLAEDIADWSGISHERVKAAMDAITLRASESSYLAKESMPQIPLLISLENNLVIRPVSSLVRNPFIATTKLLSVREPRVRAALNAPREGWFREHLYAMFQGCRYVRVEGTINLRDGVSILTDIDAAILDRTSGCLALFQLKWQDFFTNDVRALRSRSSNLTREVDDWALKVETWLSTKTSDEIARVMRISPDRDGHIGTIMLFALSWTAARVQGFGYSPKHPRLAIANWPQFLRVRRETGPVPEVFAKIHAALQRETKATVAVTPIPAEYKIGGTLLRFEDLWNHTMDDTP